jgi:hypothetical protein
MKPDNYIDEEHEEFLDRCVERMRKSVLENPLVQQEQSQHSNQN